MATIVRLEVRLQILKTPSQCPVAEGLGVRDAQPECLCLENNPEIPLG